MLVPYVHPKKQVPRLSSATQHHSAFAFASPINGIDISQPLPGGDPLKAIRLENLVPRVLGCELRKGYVRWVSNLTNEVRSFMNYQPPTGEGKLFAACADGDVFDVTASSDSSVVPVPVLSVVGGQPPGEWTSLNFTSSGGVHVMVAVARAGGLYTYDGTDWTEVVEGPDPGQITGVDPSTFTSVSSYKGRLCFTALDSAVMWYLDTGLVTGTATALDFGPVMPHGGSLSAIANWTFDGGGSGVAATGGGLNSKLVVVGSQGDVLVYSGDDMDTAEGFRMEGRWFVGRVPAGDRFISQYGTDVVILSERGMSFLSEIMRGQGFFNSALVGKNINSELAVQVSNTINSRYWEVSFLPSEQLLVINRPDPDFSNLQWGYEVNTKAFCTLSGIPMNTVTSFDGRSFCGDLEGNVWWCFQGDSDGTVDEVLGRDLEGTCVSTFQPFGEGFRIKRFLMVRPSFIATSPPAFKAQINGEWNLNLPQGVPAYIGAGSSLWDNDKWDRAVWGGVGKAYEAWSGATGTGRYGSLALRVRGPAGTIFVGWNAVVTVGGIL